MTNSAGFTLLNPNLTAEGYSGENMLRVTQEMGANIALVRNSPKLVRLCHDAGITTLYREAGDDQKDFPLEQDPVAFVKRRALRAEGGQYADIIHLTNEIGLPDGIDEWTKIAAFAAEDLGRKVAFYNLQTNFSLVELKRHQDTIEWLTERGHVAGIHVYLDGDESHDRGALEPLEWLLEIGAHVLITEFGYIRSIHNAHLGWRDTDLDYIAWLDANVPLLRNATAFLFSIDDWPTDSPEAIANGFGVINFPEVYRHAAQINAVPQEQNPMTYDLAQYLCAPGPIYGMGGVAPYSSFESCQVQTNGKIVYQVKNTSAESLWYDSSHIYRGLDTSPGNNQVYVQKTGGKYGAIWARRHMNRGDTFRRVCDIHWFTRGGAPVKVDLNVVSYLKLLEHYDHYRTPNGASFSDVIKLTWLWSPTDTPTEIYYYAKGVGLIEFSGPDYKSAAVTGAPQFAPSREILSWFDESNPYYAGVPVSYPRPEDLGRILSGTVVKANAVNLRTEPSAASASTIRGQIRVGQKVQYREKSWPNLSDGNTWTYLENLKLWVSQYATIQPDPTRERELVNLNLVYVSQLGPDANLRNNDCGIAQALSAALTRLVNVGYGAMPIFTINNLIDESPLKNNDNVVGIGQLENFLGTLGIPAAYSDKLTPDVIRTLISAGKPVLALINYVVFDPAQRFGHYAMVVGLAENDTFIVNDSYQQGEGFQLSRAQLERGLTDLKAANGNSFAYKPYQGFILAIK